MEDRQEEIQDVQEEIQDVQEENVEEEVQPIKKELSAEEILEAERGRLDKKYNSEIDKLTNQLAKFEKEKDEARKAEMSELEVVREEIETLKAQNELITREKEELETNFTKTTWINENATGLPMAYKKLVEGISEEDMTESLSKVVAQYEADIESIVGEKKPSIGQKAPTIDAPIELGDTPIHSMSNDQLKDFLKKKGVD